MAIYTKRGDKGETSLYDPAASQSIRISKASAKINAIGSIDELNSFLGFISTKAEKDILKKIRNVQVNLFTIGSILARAKLRFGLNKTTQLEEEIDEMEGSLPVLKNFILVGGSEVAAGIQFARSLTRRAERALATLNEIEKVKPEILTFINRLSDYLFMLSRKINYDKGISEANWKSGKMIKKPDSSK